jgi:nitrogen PTS system EIIA component
VEIADLIAPEGVIAALPANDKAQVLRELAQRAAKATGTDEQTLSQALQAREALGSTGVGQGIALPHCRLPKLPGFFGLFARLDRAIDFAAIDERPVDLVFLLLIPEQATGEALSALALISRRLRDRETAAALRATAAARSPRQLYALLTAAT